MWNFHRFCVLNLVLPWRRRPSARAFAPVHLTRARALATVHLDEWLQQWQSLVATADELGSLRSVWVAHPGSTCAGAARGRICGYVHLDRFDASTQ
ncbi:unnamed protein product [Closterium sp. NIES-64]|nr:unnamed protein product [Closterium sp. NIES-64]